MCLLALFASSNYPYILLLRFLHHNVGFLNERASLLHQPSAYRGRSSMSLQKTCERLFIILILLFTHRLVQSVWSSLQFAVAPATRRTLPFLCASGSLPTSQVPYSAPSLPASLPHSLPIFLPPGSHLSSCSFSFPFLPSFRSSQATPQSPLSSCSPSITL